MRMTMTMHMTTHTVMITNTDQSQTAFYGRPSFIMELFLSGYFKKNNTFPALYNTCVADKDKTNFYFLKNFKIL